MTTISAFFEQLLAGQPDPRLHMVSGSVRFDIRNGDAVEQWLLDIDDGYVRMARDIKDAGTVITVSRQTAEAMVRGELNGVAAINRGEIIVDGDLGLALRLGRLFPLAPESARVDPSERREATG